MKYEKSVASGIFDLRNREVWSGDVIRSTAPPFSSNTIEIKDSEFGFYSFNEEWVNIENNKGFYITIENVLNGAPHVNKRRSMTGNRSWY